MWLEHGPSYEDLEIGWTLESERFTITPGHTAWFLAIGGDQNATHLRAPDGGVTAPVNTALLAHLAIGHSTAATREVIANLFYRDVVFSAPVFHGTTLRTHVTVVDRAMATARPDRPTRGKVMLHIVMRDDDDRQVLSMYRCALMPSGSTSTAGAGHPMRTAGVEAGVIEDAVTSWRHLLPCEPGGPTSWALGAARRDHLSEPVVDALALVRLTGNEARAHRDPAFGRESRRLVYGGHTLSLAQSALSRLVAHPHVVLNWAGCDHPSPVFEDDLLTTAATLVERTAKGRTHLLTLDVVTSACTGSDEARVVQRWRPRLLVARDRDG